MDLKQSLSYTLFWHFYQAVRIIVCLRSKTNVADQIIEIVKNMQIVILFAFSVHLGAKYED